MTGLVLTGLVVPGEETRLGAQQAPGREMTLDFLALTADGAPIPDLKAEDLTLRIGGRPRTIKGIKLVSFGAATPAPAATPEAKPAGPAAPFGTNVGAAASGGGGDSGSRAYLFLVDTESILPNVEKRLRDSIDKVVGTLTPRDRVGLVAVPRPTLNVPLSMNHAAFRTSLGQVASAGAGAGGNQGCRTRDVLDMMRNIVSALNPADGPYNVVLMSDGLVLSATGTCEVTNSDYQRVPSVFSTARARLYVVHATETVAGRNDGLETLAGVTGAGAVIRLAGSDNPLARIPRETAMHYVVTFDVEPAERTGQLSRVELRTARQGATIRATNEIAMSKADAAAAPAASMATDLAGMLKSSAAFTALPLRGAALFPTRIEGTGVRILAMLEAVDPGTKFTGAGAGLIDDKNNIVTNAKATEKQLAAASIIVPLDAPGPGTYRVRFVATDEKGRSGAVEHSVDTNFIALGPLKFSGLFVGAPGTAGCGPKLVFSTEEAICAIVEMYGQPTAQMAATLEILPAAGGKAIASVGMAGAATSQPDRFNLSAAQVPIAALAPGDYIIRAVIGMQGHPDAVVERTLRKVGK